MAQFEITQRITFENKERQRITIRNPSNDQTLYWEIRVNFHVANDEGDIPLQGRIVIPVSLIGAVMPRVVQFRLRLGRNDHVEANYVHDVHL